jgi:hypothetical protein
MHLTPIQYTDLNAKQKEIYNFQKVAAKLADYGFNCMKLSDDWQGADFLAYHKDGSETLKVQLKGRLLIDRRYLNKDLMMTFPLDGEWYLVAHDAIVAFFETTTDYLKSPSWLEQGAYHMGKPNEAIRAWLKDHRL